MAAQTDWHLKSNQIGPIAGPAVAAMKAKSQGVTPAATEEPMSVFGVPMSVLTSTFFGAMKGGAVNAKIDHMNNVIAQKNAATVAQGMKTQETINRNLQASEDAHTRNQIAIQANQRDAEGAAAAEAAATGASPEQAVRETQRNAAVARANADRELQYAADQADMASWATAMQMNNQIGTIEYNPYLNIALAASGAVLPSMMKSGLVK